MKYPLLTSLDIRNFRSIKGHIHAPLDANVVLVHGENGAGKTSLLSAIELALTGNIQALRRADANYESQLLHRSAGNGGVIVEARGEGLQPSYSIALGPKGVESKETLSQPLAALFSERSYLPQSLLGQLLQIYQDAGETVDSPLARFVSELLGLDRLDALEAGLKPFVDVRNVRKVVDSWSEVEIQKSRLEKLLDDQRRSRQVVAADVEARIAELSSVLQSLGLTIALAEDTIGETQVALAASDDELTASKIYDHRRTLESIVRELAKPSEHDLEDLGLALAKSVQDFQLWNDLHAERASKVRDKIEALLSRTTLPGTLDGFADSAFTELHAAYKVSIDTSTRAREDLRKLSDAENQLEVARKKLEAIDVESSKISSKSGSLGSALAELTSFIDNDICPVCDRDYSEVGTDTLSDHVHARVRTLSASAERLLTLGRSRGEQQRTVEELERSRELLTARVLDSQVLANLDRRAADLNTAIFDLESIKPDLAAGGNLWAAEVAARRAFSDRESRNAAVLSAQKVFEDLALRAGQPGLRDGETLSMGVERLARTFDSAQSALEGRLRLRRSGLDLISRTKTALGKRREIDAEIGELEGQLNATEASLRSAQALRQNGIAIRNAVDEVRSSIIRQEFNERLNRVWRDLFVRLAPNEPFVPAFRIPETSTHRLQPKLVTVHRDGGGAGGTPGAMLSAGNLNTAALTLFVALHLSVRTPLPWLILDDPVQSMDDVHISHFAALLRTIAKDHGRQVMIAVHDRQLFDYLKLELSPAYPDDSLLTLELSRSPYRDTLCISERLHYREETSLSAVA